MYGDRHIWAGIRQTASPKVNSRTVKKSSLHPQPDSHTITRADQDVNMGNLVGIFKALCNPSVCKVMPPSIFRSYTKCICSIAQSQPTLRPRGLEPARFLCPWHSQARILECVVISSSRGSSRSRDQTHVSFVPCTGWQILYH